MTLQTSSVFYSFISTTIKWYLISDIQIEFLTVLVSANYTASLLWLLSFSWFISSTVYVCKDWQSKLGRAYKNKESSYRIIARKCVLSWIEKIVCTFPVWYLPTLSQQSLKIQSLWGKRETSTEHGFRTTIKCSKGQTPHLHSSVVKVRWWWTVMAISSE